MVATTQQEKKEGEKDKSKEIVEISQVLPGYARSYAVDYVPNEVRMLSWRSKLDFIIDVFQVNNHSFSTFANTISFNISRYPTPVEITDSKNYRGPDKSDQQAEKPGGVENGAARSEEEEEAGLSVSSAGGDTNSNIEYVPAEYFRGVDTHQFAQSGEISEQSK